MSVYVCVVIAVICLIVAYSAVVGEPSLLRKLYDFIFVKLHDDIFPTEVKREQARASDEDYAEELFPGVGFYVRELIHAASHYKYDKPEKWRYYYKARKRVTDCAESLSTMLGFTSKKQQEDARNNAPHAASDKGVPQDEKDKKQSKPKKDPYLAGKYVVYIDYHYKVRVDAWGSACRRSQTQEQRDWHAKADMLNALPVMHLKKSHRLAFKRMVGQIYVCAIGNDLKMADVLYGEAMKYYDRQRMETFRCRQVFFALIVYAAAIAILHWLAEPIPANAGEQIPTGFSCCAGSFSDDIRRIVPTVHYVMIASLAGSFFAIFKKALSQQMVDF